MEAKVLDVLDSLARPTSFRPSHGQVIGEVFTLSNDESNN